MPVTILREQTEEKQIILPQAHGIEPRDIAQYPLPPGCNLALVQAVVDELRSHDHEASFHVEHERLVDWSRTHERNQRSHGWEDDWRPDPKGPQVLFFVSGGADIRVTVDGVETRLEARHLRMGRQGLRVVVGGRP